jgi:hypothetical protein
MDGPFLAASFPVVVGGMLVRGRITNSGRVKVGLAWAGTVKNLIDYRRSIPLITVAPLLQSGADVYSLSLARHQRKLRTLMADHAISDRPDPATYTTKKSHPIVGGSQSTSLPDC